MPHSILDCPRYSVKMKFGPNRIAVILLTHIVLIFLCPLSIFAQRNISQELQIAIDDFVENDFIPSSGGINGTALGLAIIQNDGELFYTTGYGTANFEKDMSTTNSTQFNIASITKSFAAILAAKLLHEKFPEKGESVLDTPIRELLPSINFTLVDRFRSEHATFRDILAHRLCIFQDDLYERADAINTTDELVYRARFNEEICGMRTSFQYSNRMYGFMGYLIAVLADKPTFHDAMGDFLNDLGMMNSELMRLSDDFSKKPSRAMPYYIWENKPVPFNENLVKRATAGSANGGLFSTPDDMARYLRLHINLGELDGQQIVPKEVMEWVRKPSMFLSPRGFKTSDEDLVYIRYAYGLGLVLSTYDGWEIIGHSGGWPTYISQLSFFPGTKLGIFSTTNLLPLQGRQRNLHLAIFDIIHAAENGTREETISKWRKRLAQDTQTMVHDKPKNSTIDNPVSSSFKVEEIIGKYGSGSMGDVEVSEKYNEGTNQTECFIDYGIWYKGWLEPQGETPDGHLFKLNFVTDVIQDDYANGFTESQVQVRIKNGTLTFLTKYDDEIVPLGSFQLGVSLEKLPVLPWSPESC